MYITFACGSLTSLDIRLNAVQRHRVHVVEVADACNIKLKKMRLWVGDTATEVIKAIRSPRMCFGFNIVARAPAYSDFLSHASVNANLITMDPYDYYDDYIVGTVFCGEH